MKYVPAAQHHLTLPEARERLAAVDSFISKRESPKPDRPTEKGVWSEADVKHVLSMSNRKLYGKLRANKMPQGLIRQALRRVATFTNLPPSR